MALANKEQSNDTKLNSNPIDFCMMKQDSLAMIKHILYILSLSTYSKGSVRGYPRVPGNPSIFEKAEWNSPNSGKIPLII